MTSTNNNSIHNKPSSRYIKLQIQYGSDHYEIFLSDKDKKIRVEQLLDEIEKLTKVPKCHQTVMYKGQRLDHKPQANLDDLYIFNNSKLILSGTQQQYHDKYCCPDHDHNIINTSGQNNNAKEDKSNITIVDTHATKQTNPTGFIPEPNKTYEYYTVPYKTDPATLFQTIGSSTSK